MNRKWLRIVFSFFLVVMLAGCGRILRVREPFSYRFEVGKTYRYKVKVESQVSLEAGLVGYQGNIVVNAVLLLTPVDFQEGQYRFQMLIRDVTVDNVERSIAGPIYGYINYLSTVFYEWYMTPSGRITVYYRNLPLYPLQWLANMVIVDVSNWDNLVGKGEERQTNFSAQFQEQEVIVESVLFQRLVKSTREIDTLEQRYTFTAAKEKSFPLASLELQMETLLGRQTGRLVSKSGDFQFQGSIPFLKQGIFTLSARFQGIGRFVLEEDSQK